MPATFSSLPPEVLLEILSCLPRPQIEAEPSGAGALVRAALINKRLRAVSQRLLFSSVTLNTDKAVKWWSVTDARAWTSELEIELRQDDRGRRRLEKALRAGLDGTAGAHRVQLRVLVLHLWSHQSLTNRLLTLPAFEALQSLSLNWLEPRTLHSPALRNLAHLQVPTDSLDDPLPYIPLLTHLTLTHLPDDDFDLAAAFPRLTHLTVRRLLLTFAVRPTRLTLLLPPTLAHFATDHSLNAVVRAALPARLASLTLGRPQMHDAAPSLSAELAGIRARWLAAEADEEAEGSRPRLGLLTVRPAKTDREGAALEASRREPATQVEVEAIRQAGCRVEFSVHAEAGRGEWRGE